MNTHRYFRKHVTPYAGVWIEMMIAELKRDTIMVTPYAGVWIEIQKKPMLMVTRTKVTPYAGVWIEIRIDSVRCVTLTCHSLRGSVD